MRRYRFPLASVLRIRKVEEDQAIGALVAAERRRIAAEEAAQRREDARLAARPADGIVSLDQFLAARDRQERAASALVAAQAELAAARKATVASRAALAAAAAARNALEQLDERRRAEHALEMQREETIEVDDLVTGRHRREHA